jgi:hypothetical protein
VRSHLRRVLVAVLALAGLPAIAGAAGPAPVSSREAQAIRAVVEAQLDAMAAGDDARAFSYASPSVRMQFRDAPSFMSMVQHGYPMLIKPSATLFLRPEVYEHGVLQVIHLRDQDGGAWRAVYQLQKQPDRSWRINGCVVQPAADDPMT